MRITYEKMRLNNINNKKISKKEKSIFVTYYKLC